MDYTKAINAKFDRLSVYMSPDRIVAFARDMMWTHTAAKDFTLALFWCELAEKASVSK